MKKIFYVQKKNFLLPSVKNYMPSSHSILSWKYCHNVSQDYSFAAPQWRSPWASGGCSHPSEVEAEHRRAKGLSLQRPQGWEDSCARTAVSMRYAPLPAPGEQSLVTGVLQPGPSSVPSAPLSRLLQTTQASRDIKPMDPLRHPEVVPHHVYPKIVLKPLLKVNRLISNHWFDFKGVKTK